MERLILWDIDGTLIYSGGVAGEAMRAAMARVYGSATSQTRESYAGKTDQQIIVETFPGDPPEALLGQLDRFSAAYIEELSARRSEFLARARVLDGVVAALEQLAGPAIVQTVLTGNIEPIARMKLEMVQLAQFFDLGAGAYGSDHLRRPELVPIAVARAEQRYGRRIHGAQVVVIGDTPNDIACGRAGGARTIGVASGPFSVAELRDCGADLALPSLADTEAVIAAIYQG